MKPSAYTRQYTALRAWLKVQREAQGLSLRDVGARLGRHHSVIGKLEQDRRRIDVVEYVEYCLSLDLDPHEGLDVLIRAYHSKHASLD